MIKLYSYYRSSAAYRVRIALNLKGIPYEYKSIHLLKNGGEQHSQAYHELNPMGLVPTLVDGDTILSQSIAIIEYLDEEYPETNSLFPIEPAARAHVRELSQAIACDVHPINNLRVLKYLKHKLDVDDTQKNEWYSHWIKLGFDAFEQYLIKTSGDFCVGDQITLADCCLVPQVYNALRFKIKLDTYPLIQQVYENCMQLSEFTKATPENQPDAA